MFVYFLSIIILSIGLMLMLVSDNYLRKIIGLSIFQSAVLIFYIALAKVRNGVPPIIRPIPLTYTSPVPHVLMLTAIVVGFATLSVGLALIYRIYKQYNSISEHEISLHNDDVI